MRYACRLAGKPADYDRRFPGTYNARRDSLDDYWNKVYGRNHAVMVISGFYENVSLHLYEHRELATGEKEKNLVLEYDPQPSQDMLVAHWDSALVSRSGIEAQVRKACAPQFARSFV